MPQPNQQPTLPGCVAAHARLPEDLTYEVLRTMGKALGNTNEQEQPMLATVSYHPTGGDAPTWA